LRAVICNPPICPANNPNEINAQIISGTNQHPDCAEQQEFMQQYIECLQHDVHQDTLPLWVHIAATLPPSCISLV
jgi:hypothetical protein